MIGIVVCGHGHFASGITSTLNLIAGSQENYAFVDFKEGMSGDNLSEALSAAIESLSDKSHVLVLTDILGGAPFRAASLIATQNTHIEVVSGTNAQMLIEACLEREDYDSPSQLAYAIIASAKEGISSLSLELKEKAAAKAAQNTNTDDSEGI